METHYGKQMCPLGPLTFCPYKDQPSADFIFSRILSNSNFSCYKVSEQHLFIVPKHYEVKKNVENELNEKTLYLLFMCHL